MYLGSKQHLDNLAKVRDKVHKTKCQCKFCNNTFGLSNIKKHERHCYLNPDNLKPCVQCGEPVKNYKKSVTCGYSCANKHFRTGPNHGNWKEEKYTTTCFHFHKKECVVCGESNIVEVHHLDEVKTNNSPSNLIPLCPTHHQYWHSRFKPLVEQKVLDYIDNWLKEQTS